VIWAGDQLEAGNAVLVRLKDVVWALGRDRTSTARGVAELAQSAVGQSAPTITAYWAIQVALSALDRLEVRGRDSAGLHVLVSGHGIALDQPDVDAALSARTDELFRSMAIRAPGGHLSFVYKVAAEIGELGDNTHALRAAIATDALLHRALAGPDVVVTVLGHTRWASVGAISEANAHPLDGEELMAAGEPYVVAAINGDIDNHADLRDAEGLRLPPEITTDSKILPTLVAQKA
jgi:glucosamine--fructose-6-phosphate aminotransferase (isomerizing)